jgi:D-aspartate ligase
VTEVAERGALEACRGLHADGYAVSGVARTRLAPGHWSRSVERRYRILDARVDEALFVDALVKILHETKHDVVLPGGEASLLAISRYRDRFGEVLHGLPPDEIVLRALDKVALLETAEACDLAAPASHVCTTMGDARAAARSLGFPLVVKPPRSIFRGAGVMRQQGIGIGGEELTLEAAAAASATPFIVQRFEINPVRLSCAGVYVSGGLRALAVARYVRMWPPAAGAASFAQTLDPPEKLVTRIEALLGRVGWNGIFEVEVLALPRGRLAAMDLNPRVFGWMALAGRAGTNLAGIWCDFLRGRNRPLVIARSGVSYRWEDAELLHLLRHLRRGSLRSATAVAKPQRRAVHGYGRLTDPAPLAARMLDVAGRNLRRAAPRRSR